MRSFVSLGSSHGRHAMLARRDRWQEPSLGFAIQGDGRRVGGRWMFRNAALRWIIEYPQDLIATCMADLHYGMPRLRFTPLLARNTDLAGEWFGAVRSQRRNRVAIRRSSIEEWCPRAFLAFRREQLPTLAQVLQRSGVARGRGPFIGPAIILGPRPDLVVLPAEYVAIACTRVRPAALLWDISPAWKYLDRYRGMVVLPPVLRPHDLGRWRLPGEVDVDASALRHHAQIGDCMVA